MGQGIFSHLCVVSFHVSIGKKQQLVLEILLQSCPGCDGVHTVGLRPGRRELLNITLGPKGAGPQRGLPSLPFC